MDLLIQKGLVVSEGAEEVGDVLCSGGKIARIASHIDAPAGAEVINAEGKLVIPGGVDVHTHMDLDVGIARASDDFYTGTVAAAFGGTTTIVDHIGFGPARCALDHQIRVYHGLARDKAVIDYGFHGVIQHVDDEVLAAMDRLAEEGITSYKVYLTYDFKLSDAEAYRALKKAREAGLLITVHPENHDVIQYLRAKFVAQGKTTPVWHPRSRPVECEAEAISRMILLARLAGDAPLYIVHLSNGLGLDFIRDARRHGQRRLYAETCPQYLFLEESRYEGGLEGLKYVMCPPLRTPADQARLWEGLAGGDIDTVATDHCPFFFATQKMRGKDDFTRTPSGAPGVEERLPLLFSEGVVKGRLSLRRFVDLCAANPARLFGLYPQKGVLKEGSDADLVVLDPAREAVLSKAEGAAERLHANVDYTAYEGMKVTGWPFLYTVSRGEVIVRQGELCAAPGRGRFLRRLRYANI